MTPTVAPALSEMELAVLRLVAEGWTADEIGVRVYLSTGSVKATCARLLRKLEARDRAHAVDRAWRCGLLQGEG